MSFQVSDVPGQPLICCDRTLGPHCIGPGPLFDGFISSCRTVQETNPFELFSKHAGAPLIFVLEHPSWVLWLGLCVTWRVLGVGREAAAVRHWKWQSFMRPTLLVEVQAHVLLLLWLASCPQAVLILLGFSMLALTTLVEIRKAMNLVSRNENIMRQAGMTIRPNETQAQTADRVHAETMRLRKMNDKAKAKKDAVTFHIFPGFQQKKHDTDVEFARDFLDLRLKSQ